MRERGRGVVCARMKPRIGVCSWSLRAESPEQLADRIAAVGVRFAQLHLDPLRERWSIAATTRALSACGIALVSGMMTMAGEDYATLESIQRTGGVRPDATWDENRRAARENAKLARSLGLQLVTFHAGFIPHDRQDPERTTLLARLRELVDVFAEQDVRVGFETGQETATTLLDALDALDRPRAGINFDPANMILYDQGDPVKALTALAPRVLQCHVKDATRTRVPGQWGAEVRVGTGDVDWRGFFAALRAAKLDVDLCIEREAGDDRIADMRAAHELVLREVER